MKKTIQVTKSDILQGVCDSPYRCALALATQRVFKLKTGLDGDDEISIGSLTARVNKNGVKWLASLTPAAQRFIERFDGHEEVKPSRFTLNFNREYP